MSWTFLCSIRKIYTVHLTLYWNTGSAHWLTTCRITFESLTLPTFLLWILSWSINQSQICWLIKCESITNWEATVLGFHYFSSVQIQTWVYKILRWIWYLLSNNWKWQSTSYLVMMKDPNIKLIKNSRFLKNSNCIITAILYHTTDHIFIPKDNISLFFHPNIE